MISKGDKVEFEVLTISSTTHEMSFYEHDRFIWVKLQDVLTIMGFSDCEIPERQRNVQRYFIDGFVEEVIDGRETFFVGTWFGSYLLEQAHERDCLPANVLERFGEACAAADVFLCFLAETGRAEHFGVTPSFELALF